MSKRNREGKARRRAERERQRQSMTSGQGPRAVADGGLVGVEPDGADLDTDAGLENADPGDFGALDADDAGLQAALTVLAVLADDLGDVAELADDLVGDADVLDVLGGP